MCGIIACVGGCLETAFSDALVALGKLKHRGPDHSRVVALENAVLGHARLSIVGLESGSQPFTHEDCSALTINGEIYNYKELSSYYLGQKKPKNDCSVVFDLLEKAESNGIREIVQAIDGVYAFVYVDKEKNRLVVARDPIGICSLYYIKIGEQIWFSSELKAISHLGKVQEFPPGHYLNYSLSNVQSPIPINSPLIHTCSLSNFSPLHMDTLDALLYSAVKKRFCHADVKVGLLLSGGLDSTIVAAYVSKICKENGIDPKTIPSYSIGTQDSEDVKRAREVAEHYSFTHTEIEFDIKSSLKMINEVVKQVESYDVTTVRCSVPTFLLAKRIKEDGVKCVFSGEGADEILGGYLYCLQSPDKNAMHNECHKLVKNLHRFDVLRAHKAGLAHSVELRFPFLDLQVVKYVLSITPHHKLLTPEKTVLRDLGNVLQIPLSVVQRQKEQFSDGVGYGWINQIAEEYGKNEKVFFRECFMKAFGPCNAHLSSLLWVPRWGSSSDPSGRQVAIHRPP